MNKKWLQKGRDPTQRYPISQAQWARFREMRESEDFKEKSKAASALAKRNKYPHRLGTGGYKTQIPKQRAAEAEKRKQGEVALTDLVDERTANWMCGQKTDTSGSKVSAPVELEDVTAKIIEVAAKQKKGEFKPRRENDILTQSLGNYSFWHFILFE